MIVAMTGATGSVGRFIVKRLLEEGAGVRAWRRPSSDLTGLPPGIEWIEGSLGDRSPAEALVTGADALIHAALEHVPGRYRGGEGDDPERFWRLNVDGSLALIQAARDAGVKRAIVFSSRAVFGRNAEGALGDDARPSPDTHYGAAKAALETFVSKFAGEFPVAVLRPTGIYGIVEPAARSKWFALVKDALAGRHVTARAGTEVHGSDVAAAVWALLEAPSAAIAGRAFNCSDIVVSHRDIVRVVQKVAGVSGPLPEEGEHPRAILRTDRLAALGVRFGGRPLFESTVAALVAAVGGSRAEAED